MPQEQNLLREVSQEHGALTALNDAYMNVTASWLDRSELPAPDDVARFSGLGGELCLHLDRHLHIEDNKILPMAAALLSPDELMVIAQELELKQRGAGRLRTREER
jgi:hemerythrin-like domain-containing protein